MVLDCSISELKGVGCKRAELYKKLDIFTVGDLLRHYPRAYEDWSKVTPVSLAMPNEPCCVRGWVIAAPSEYRVRKGMTLYRFRVSDGENTIQVTLFNNRYAAAKIHRDEEVLLYGTVTRNGRHFEMSSPLVEAASTGERIRAIYRQTEGLSSRMIEANVRQALALVEVSDAPDCLPQDLRERVGLCDQLTAWREVHFPANSASLDAARRRLVFEELFLMQIGLLQMKNRARGVAGARITVDYTDEYVAGLPFKLTGAQSRAIAECVRDLVAERPMSRLVQGDVGSGKTAVAAGVAYTVIRGGWQAAMMAPTEILAEQHAGTLQKLFGERVRIGLLTGSIPAAKRKTLLTALEEGEIDLLVGTHALIGEHVHFARLGLVITDEQHRFGVGQRAALAAKGVNPHMLVMSATPIPRTLALILYGDLDVSVLDELPPGRQPIQTFAINSQKRERAYGYVRRHLDEGRQGYIVCPLVEEGEEPSDLTAATELFERLQSGPFNGYKLGLLHGRMKPAEKEATMAAFAAGEIQLLVSTTVIEVGVDVPNAVILVVENAERFGLAQLHQLRGRVGRGQYLSTCILISDHSGEETRRRMQVMCVTTDGFRIADEDLKMRGPGDFFGSRQHGLPNLKMADLMTDMPLVQLAQMSAANRLESDPKLTRPENAPLKQAVARLFAQVGAQGLN